MQIMTIQYTTTQWPVKRLVEWRKKGKLFIPRHQRGFVWNLKHQRLLIDTIRRGLPIPSLTLSGTDLSGNKYSIEDGQQRIETLVRFCDNKFDLEGIFFTALGEDGQQSFLEYRVPILMYTGANHEERIEIFDRLQNGIALSHGERFHAMRFLSPLVQYTCETLLYEDATLQKSIETIWGPRKLDGDPKVGDGTKRYRTLREAVCLIAGSLWGPEYFTEIYDTMREKIRLPLTEGAKERSLIILKQLIAIYTKAMSVSLGGEDKLSEKALKDSFWNPKYFSGYILYSLWEHPGQWPQIEKKWVDFLVQYRKKPTLLKEKLLEPSYKLKDLDLKYKAGWLSIQNKYTNDTREEADYIESEED
jgi:hypothetical protein